MKKTVFKTGAIIIFFLILFAACNPDDINNLLITRDNYLGTWSVSDSDAKKRTYEVTISANPNNSSQIIINNFHQYGSSYFVYGVVSGKNLTIDYQTVLGETVNGDGVLKSGVLTITYYVNDVADLKTYIATYTK